MDRNDKILRLIDKADTGLEIGPSYSPIAPKSGGWNVEIADHLDAPDLREKYAAWGVDVGSVEDVDYVITDKSLSETIGKPGHYDFIIASHVIEHTPDMIGFLQDCETLLKPGGVLSLVVPDKRFCFDVYKPRSSTGTILQAHLDRLHRHKTGTIFDAYADHVLQNGELIGFNRASPYLSLGHTLGEAHKLAMEFHHSDGYVDTHTWKYTPASFQLIIQDLNQLDYIQMGMETFDGTVGFEFYASLRKGGDCNPTSRIDLLRQASEEECEPCTSASAHDEPKSLRSRVRNIVGKFRPQPKPEPAEENQVYFSHSGHCPICDTDVEFVSENDWFRDQLLCTHCLSNPRERAVMHVIQTKLPRWRKIQIHESSPAFRAASRKLQRQGALYVSTQYDPKVALGETHPTLGFRCEDLRSQTFADESFDLVVTQDVFEHVPDPEKAIAEIARTLKPGGAHVASVPIVRKWEPSRPRARLKDNGEWEHLLPPEYQGNPVDDEGSLVVTDWGYDIAQIFKEASGMDTVIMQIDDIDLGIRAEYIEIVVSRKPE